MTTKNGKPRDRNKAKGNGKATVPLTSLLNKRKSKEENPTCEKCGQKRYSRRVSDGEEQTKIYSRFCERHTCRADLPESLDQGFCPTPKSKKKHHCPDHSKCGRADCTEYGEYPNWELPFVCLNHQCRNEGCLNECIIHREWCGEHLCSRPNCGYPADTDRGVSLCVAHACRFPNCTNGAYDHNGLCPSHLPCTHQGCSAPRKPLEGNRARLHPFCVRHMPCEVDGCNNFAQERHKLCSYHSCHINNCTKQSEDKGSFCDDHTCHVSGCLSSIHNVVDPESRYCVYHCCRADDCLGEAVSNGGYCNEHVCLAHGCKRGRTERTTYCMEHNCKEPGCRYEAMVVGGYCRPLGHGCTEIGCRQRAIGGAQGVRQCEDHLIASVKRLGFDEAAEEYSARIDELQREVDDIRTQDPHEVTFDMPPVPPSPRYAMGYRVPYGVGFDMPPRSPNPGYAMRYREPHEVGFDLPPMPPSQSYATGYPDPVGYRPYRMVRPHFSETLAGPSRYDQYRPRGRQEFYE